MAQDIASDLVNLVPCFSSLSPRILKKISAAIEQRSYQKNDILFLQDEPCAGLFVLKSGIVKMFRLIPEGREVTIRVAYPSCLDCVPLLDDGPNRVTAQAIVSSQAYFLPRKYFLSLLQEEPLLTQQIARLLAAKSRHSLMRSVAIMGNLESRVACVLTELAQTNQCAESEVSLSQEELACLAGVSRQRLNIYLGKLAKEGIIRKHRRKISIIKPDLLEKSLCY